MASRSGHGDAIKLLLAAKATVDQPDKVFALVFDALACGVACLVAGVDVERAMRGSGRWAVGSAVGKHRTCLCVAHSGNRHAVVCVLGCIWDGLGDSLRSWGARVETMGGWLVVSSWTAQYTATHYWRWHCENQQLNSCCTL